MKFNIFPEKTFVLISTALTVFAEQLRTLRQPISIPNRQFVMTTDDSCRWAKYLVLNMHLLNGLRVILKGVPLDTTHAFWLADCIILFVHYAISLSALGKLIWRHWTYKMLVGYILSSVWVRLSIFCIFSQLSTIQYVGLCFSVLLAISLVMIENIYIYILCLIIIRKSEVWTIIHCLGLDHETMVCAVSLSIIFWLGLMICMLWSDSDHCRVSRENQLPDVAPTHTA